MSKVENKGRVDYSKFDNIDSDILEAYLRADLNAPEGERIEPEAISYIIDLLSERQKDDQIDWEQKTAEALDEFLEDYYPYLEEAQDVYDFYNDFGADVKPADVKNGKIKILSRFRKIKVGLASVAVIVVLLLCGGTLTASAFGFDTIKLIGRWNGDDFWFEPAAVTAELADVVAEYAGDTDLVPKSLPAGYLFGDVFVSECDSFMKIDAVFYRETDIDTNELYINYKIYLSNNKKPLYEKDNIDVNEYIINDIEHYIISNLDKNIIIWQNENIEGAITGNFSLNEAEKIIDSIYGE